jgi:hypothetical protein
MVNKPDVTATPNGNRWAKFTSHFPAPSPCGGAVHGRDQSLQPLYCVLWFSNTLDMTRWNARYRPT